MKENSQTTTGDTESEESFDSTGKRKSFRRLITRFAEKTSMQGPPYINMAKLWWAKVIWATLLIAAVIVMFLHLWYLFQQWYSWPKTTTISLGFDDLAFPQVTICNTNVLHKKRFNKFKGASELKMLVEDLRPENFVPRQFDDNYDPTQTNNNQQGDQQGVTQPGGNQQGVTQPGGNQQGVTQPDGNQQGVTQPGRNQQSGTPPGENMQGGTQPGGNQQDVTQPGRNHQGVTQPGNNQQSGTPPGGNQQGGTQPGGNQQGVTQPGGNQQDVTHAGGNQQRVTQPGRNQQSGTPPGGNQQGVTQPGGNQQGGAPPEGNQQVGTQSQSVASTSPSVTRRGKTKAHLNTQTTKARSQSGPGGASSPPNSRRKRFDKNYDNLNVSKYLSDYKNYDEESRDRNDLDSPMDSQREIENIFRELYMNINKLNRNHLGHQISDMLVGCTFNGRQCPSNVFSLHQTAEYGNCWTISSDKFTVRRAGPGGGLTIILFLETNEYLKGLTTGYGARVQFQERETYPFPFDEGVFISGAMETDVGLKFRTISRLGGDYGTCDDGVEFQRLYNLTYTRRACQAFCRITSVIKTCKCFDDHWEEFAFKKDDSLRPCRSEKEQMCRVDILQQFRQGNIACQCDNPCHEVEYLKSVSARQWPTNEYARVLLDWLCEKDPDTCKSLRKDINNIWAIKNNFLKLNLYYEDLNFENITETAQIELQQFLSDIGGAFGLWIGLSVLSLCEVIQLLVELFDYGFHKAVSGQRADTDRKPTNITESSGISVNPEKEIDNGLPQIVYDPRERLPRHMRNESPYRERNRFPYASDRGSDESLHKRKRDHDFHRLSPEHRFSPDLRFLGNSSPDLVNNLEKNDDDSRRHRRKHAHVYDSPKRARRHRDHYDRYSDFRDDYGLGRRNVMY